MRPFVDDLEVILVEDILLEGAFDKALKDVKYVIHVASPLAHQVCFPDRPVHFPGPTQALSQRELQSESYHQGFASVEYHADVLR